MTTAFNSEKFHKETQINRSDLETELCSNPANLAYYIEQAALWSGKADAFKTLRDTRGAEIYLELKNSGEKTTEGYIAAQQTLDETYAKYVTNLRLAREQLALFEGAVTALEKKQFSIGTLYANTRKEYDMTNSYVTSSSEERAARRERTLAAQG